MSKKLTVMEEEALSVFSKRHPYVGNEIRTNGKYV